MKQLEDNQANDLSQMIDKATKEELAALVEKHVNTDDKFRYEVLSALGSTVAQELAAAKELITSSIRSNTNRGYINYRGCDDICCDMDTVVENAKRRNRRGQYAEAIDLSLYIVLAAAKLASQADSSSGALSFTLEDALKVIDESTAAIRDEERAQTDARKVLDRILKTARNKAFDGWEEWRYALLCSAARICDTKSAEKLVAYLDQQLVQLKDEGHLRDFYAALDVEARYCIKRTIKGKEAARHFLNAYLALDSIRELAVREDMADGKYDNAERLCLEREREDVARSSMQPRRWNYLLYEIYTDAGQKEKQIAQAQKLFLLGDMSYYDKLKTLLIENGRWAIAYPKLMEMVKEKQSYYYYMRLLDKEGETALLMEQLRMHQELVFDYAEHLSGAYADEIYPMCEKLIRREAPTFSDRKGYRRLCAMLLFLSNIGGTAHALSLLAALRENNPRRPAMLDELNKAERKMWKRV